MKIDVITSKAFDREFKKMYKRYKSLVSDLKKFEQGLMQGNIIGDEVIKGVFKYRMAITSKNKGKSGGARIITSEILLSIDEKSIVLLTIYDKSETSNITESEILQLKKMAGLE